MSLPQIACPQCNTKYPLDPALAGKKVKCANCSHMFHLPVQPTNAVPAVPQAAPRAATSIESSVPAVAPPPFTAGPPPYVAAPHGQSAAEPPTLTPPIVEVVSDQNVRARSNAPTGFVDFLWQLLDFRVEKYLTLYIVRMYWILALFVVGLFLVGILLSLALEGPQSAFRAPTGEDAMLEFLGQPRQSTSEYADVLEAYNRFKRFSLKVIFGVSAILMVRVWCEMLVVVFNIANSLRSIEKKIDTLDRQG